MPGILFFGALGLIVMIVLGRTLLPLIRKSIVNKRLKTEGVETEAIIISMEQTGLYINNLPQVKVQMNVEQPAGRNFIAETNEVFSFTDLSGMRIGSRMKVKYNPRNHKEIMIC